MTARNRLVDEAKKAPERRPMSARPAAKKKDSGKNYVMPGDVGENPETIEPEIKKKLPEGFNFRIRSARKEKSKVWKSGSDHVSTTPRWPIGITGCGSVPMGTRAGEVFEKKKEMMAAHLGPGRYEVGKCLDKVRVRSQSFAIREEKRGETEFSGMAVTDPSGQLSARVEKPFGAESQSAVIPREHRKGVTKPMSDQPLLNIPLPPGPSVHVSVVARWEGARAVTAQTGTLTKSRVGPVTASWNAHKE